MEKLHYSYISTPLGKMISVADDSFLYLLTFGDYEENKAEILFLQKYLNKELVHSNNIILVQVANEIEQYFKHELEHFTIPIQLIGTKFQIEVWRALQNIPYGDTISYKCLAHNIKNEKAVRAVGNANGKNRFNIIVPCHRVVQNNGQLGGYTGGIHYKIYLLEHEKRKKSKT